MIAQRAQLHPRLEQRDPRSAFAEDVRRGLGGLRKSLPSKYLYDARGAGLFERICKLDQYYPTRTELAIMRRFASEIAAAIGAGAVILELGSGAAVKTRLLLDQLEEPAAYIPIDISAEQLKRTAVELACSYPTLRVEPVLADFTQPLRLRLPMRNGQRLAVYFPGSTIGNFEPSEAKRLLSRLLSILSPGSFFLVGVDLKKDPGVLHAAYNDRAGVTAEFNLNILRRINRDLAGSFDLAQFNHYAPYNPICGRIEMHLVSRCRQTVMAAGERFSLQLGESIFTESSYKYGVEEFSRLVGGFGLRLRGVWTDENKWFSVQLYEREQ